MVYLMFVYDYFCLQDVMQYVFFTAYMYAFAVP